MFSLAKILTQATGRKARSAGSPGEQVAAGVDSPESKDFYPSRSGSDSSTSATVSHRDLCTVILRDTLRMYGIPREWFSIEVLNLSKNANTVRLQINLVIQYWHEGLLIYAPALQKQFLQSLQSFDPGTDHSRHSVCWKFSSKCQCPFTEIPGPSYWATPLNQFEDVMSEPITLPPTAYRQPMQPLRADFNQEIAGATGSASVPQASMDPFGSSKTAFRFDLPPLDRDRQNFGDFPSTIPLSLEKIL